MYNICKWYSLKKQQGNDRNIITVLHSKHSKNEDIKETVENNLSINVFLFFRTLSFYLSICCFERNKYKKNNVIFLKFRDDGSRGNQFKNRRRIACNQISNYRFLKMMKVMVAINLPHKISRTTNVLA